MSEMYPESEAYRRLKKPIREGVALARVSMGAIDLPSLSAARYAAYDVALRLEPNVLVAEKNADMQEQMQLTDSLTGLDNIYGIHDNLQIAVAFADRHRIPLAMTVAYFKNLKDINDIHGHQAGDEALVAAAQILKQNVATTALARTNEGTHEQRLRGPGRLESGNTFVLLHPNVDLERARLQWDELDAILQRAGFVMQVGRVAYDDRHRDTDAASKDFLERGRAALYDELGELSYEL